MAEIKNNFISSKMNKDLDSRLVPNGQYRDANNININTSEGEDAGTVQTTLGNFRITDLNIPSANCSAQVIGNIVDEVNSIVYFFITDYIDTSIDKLSNRAPNTAFCAIYSYDFNSTSALPLVVGGFLNFSITHEIVGVNLLEELLFFTDNRNQPRKININEANSSEILTPDFYSNEDQISVAKYYPFTPISLIDNEVTTSVVDTAGTDYTIVNNVGTTGGDGFGLTINIKQVTNPNKGILDFEINNPGSGYSNNDILTVAPPPTKLGIQAKIQINTALSSTMKDRCSEYLPVSQNVVIDSLTASGDTNYPSIKVSSSTTLIQPMSKVINGVVRPYKVISPEFPQASYGLVSARKSDTEFQIKYPYDVGVAPSPIPADWVVGTSLQFFAPNPDYDSKFSGDCEYLKDKFVRFAYRFKFLDGEYSLISPFTQECFVPKQDGFLQYLDDKTAYDSTELDFFENKINEIELIIPCPTLDFTTKNDFFSNLFDEMHVTSIEILYKESDEQSIKVVDDISKEVFSQQVIGQLVYKYQSRAPYKVLPSNEITRVSDVVPIRAAAQEVSGNRVIYGNFINRHTSLETLNYQVGIGEKLNTAEEPTAIEYQNHNLKQNRTYQVGVVLSDRYGRQSDVILSSFDNNSIGTIIEFQGSTIFNKFRVDKTLLTSTTMWPGDSLFTQWDSAIPAQPTLNGYPGVYSSAFDEQIVSFYSGSGYNTANNVATTVSPSGGTGLTVNISDDAVKGGGSGAANGIITQVSINNEGSGYSVGDVITITGGNSGDLATFIYKPQGQSNLLGFYSYKIVVKQQEQEYYNTYLPSVINGDLDGNQILNPSLGYMSLFGDNINKIPKDLNDVGPTQNLFRSNEPLTFRVNNTSDGSIQYTPGTISDKVVQIGTMRDLGLVNSNTILTFQVNNNSTASSVITLKGDVPDSSNMPISGAGVTAVTTSGTEVAGLGDSDNVFVKYFWKSTSPGIINANLNVQVTVSAGDLVTIRPGGLIYNAATNPMMGVLNTSQPVGVRIADGYSDQLTVAETKPVYSNLNIFWETSTSGLIKDLNNSIIAESSNLEVGGISNITTNNFSEASLLGTAITNTFFPTDIANSNITDPQATGTLVSVFDAAGNSRGTEFEMQADGNGGFKIVTASLYLCSSNLALNNFIFNIKIQTGNFQVFDQVTAVLQNVNPEWSSAPSVDTTIGRRRLTLPPCGNGFASPGGTVYYHGDLNCGFGQLVFENCVNGSADTTRNHDGLTWEITRIEQVIDSFGTGGTRFVGPPSSLAGQGVVYATSPTDPNFPDMFAQNQGSTTGYGGGTGAYAIPDQRNWRWPGALMNGGGPVFRPGGLADLTNDFGQSGPNTFDIGTGGPLFDFGTVVYDKNGIINTNTGSPNFGSGLNVTVNYLGIISGDVIGTSNGGIGTEGYNTIKNARAPEYTSGAIPERYNGDRFTIQIGNGYTDDTFRGADQTYSERGRALYPGLTTYGGSFGGNWTRYYPDPYTSQGPPSSFGCLITGSVIGNGEAGNYPNSPFENMAVTVGGPVIDCTQKASPGATPAKFKTLVDGDFPIYFDAKYWPVLSSYNGNTRVTYPTEMDYDMVLTDSAGGQTTYLMRFLLQTDTFQNEP